jgi:tRNA-specific adenosine deaminase 1
MIRRGLYTCTSRASASRTIFRQVRVSNQTKQTKNQPSFARRSHSTKEIEASQLSKQLTELNEQGIGFEGLAQLLSPAARHQINEAIRNARAATKTIHVPEPSKEDLRAVAIATGIPFIAFGIMDNALLIIAGDAIDTSLGVILGISTMCAAALGNVVSDVAGVMMGTVVEDFLAKNIKLPAPNLTSAQRQLRSVRFANQWGCAVGMTIGCFIGEWIVAGSCATGSDHFYGNKKCTDSLSFFFACPGMFPLLFIDSNKIQARKREANLDEIFIDVINEAGSLIGAQRTSLFLLVKKNDDDDQAPPIPTPDGNYLYAKYDETSKKTQQSESFIPLGRGIVSRAALTGEAFNFYDVRNEPDFAAEAGRENESLPRDKQIRNMVCVPVLDSHGRTIAVIQAINKADTIRRKDSDPITKSHGGFSNNDVQILKALASHITVSLQRMNDKDEGMRLRDTITMLKEHGFVASTGEKRRPLFPDE